MPVSREGQPAISSYIFAIRLSFVALTACSHEVLIVPRITALGNRLYLVNRVRMSPAIETNVTIPLEYLDSEFLPSRSTSYIAGGRAGVVMAAVRSLLNYLWTKIMSTNFRHYRD